jgi:hypothetical protein
MASYVVASKYIPEINLALFERDFFDGAQFLLQDSDGVPWNLNDVVVCASVYQNVAGISTLVTSFNVEPLEPLTAGRVRIWLTSAQTAQIYDAYDGGQQTTGATAFFPTAYASQADSASFYQNSNLRWDLRIETPEEVGDLVSASAGAFTTQTPHGLGASERVFFKNTAQASINYNGTSARIYTSLTNISYQPPYSFTIPSLSGVTDPAIGGSVYRLKQDTVVVGKVIANSTVSNCFP